MLMIMMRDKKGSDILNSTAILLILNIMFFGMMFAVVTRSGSNAAYYEQIYAKQIALLIDAAKPGTSVLIKLDNAEKFIEEYKRNPSELFRINNGKSIVQLTNAKGYEIPYFSDYPVKLNFEQSTEDNSLFLRIDIMDGNAEND